MQPGLGLMGTTGPTATVQFVTTPLLVVPDVQTLVAAEVSARDPQVTVACEAPDPMMPAAQLPTSVVLGAGVLQVTVAPPLEALAV